MKKVTYTAVVDKRPIKETVYVSDNVSVPAFIKHPKSGHTLKRVGQAEETEENPPKGAIYVREFTEKELADLSSKEAESILNDLKENPSQFDNGEELKKLSKSHWLKQAKKTFAAVGKVTVV